MRADGTDFLDLISRQSAIDLLKKWADGYQYIETETKLAIKEFQELPSAQLSVQVDREKVDSLLYNIYQLQGTNLTASGVVAKRYYISQLYEMLYGEGEKPAWM